MPYSVIKRWLAGSTSRQLAHIAAGLQFVVRSWGKLIDCEGLLQWKCRPWQHSVCLTPATSAYVPIPRLTLAAPQLSTNPDLSSALMTRSLENKSHHHICNNSPKHMVLSRRQLILSQTSSCRSIQCAGAMAMHVETPSEPKN